MEVTFGDRLKLLRILHGLSQNDLSGALGIHQSKIVYYEAGKVAPRQKMVKRIASFFDCNPRWLSEGQPPAFRLAWSELPPPRYGHLNRMVRDAEHGLQELLPKFCQEHEVKRVFCFTWEGRGSVLSIGFGDRKSSNFLMIKTDPSFGEIIRKIFYDLKIETISIGTDDVSENVWEHLFREDNDVEEGKKSLRIIFQKIKSVIPDQLSDNQAELYVYKYENRLKVLQQRGRWSFPCDVTVTREGGISRSDALQEVMNLLQNYVSPTGALVEIAFKKMADNEVISPKDKDDEWADFDESDCPEGD